MTYAPTESQARALARLDEAVLDFVQAGCVMNLVGVLVGLKPAAYLEESDSLIPLLRETGVYTKKTRRNGGVAVSRTSKQATRLARDIRHTWGKKTINESIERRIGEALGYPKTATEYFVARLVVMQLGKDIPLVVPEPSDEIPHESFIQFILSPEYYKEEIAAYAKPLEEATRRYAPHSYEILTAED